MNNKFSEIELRKLDLNLLLIFSAIMREGSVGRAAKRLYLGPSAISMALSRLRETLGDPLFVRSGGGMVPTPRAERLWAEIEPALMALEVATRSTEFDPSAAEAVFTLGAPDDLEFLLVPRLMQRLADEAPKARLVVQPMDFRSLFERLDEGRVDLGLSALPRSGREARHQVKVLHRETFSILFHPGHPDISAPFTLQHFAEVPHVMVSLRGDFEGPIDAALSDHGLARQVVGTVARFATIPFILRARPVIACVPATAAAYMASEFQLQEQPLPFPSPEFDLAIAWHSRTDTDPASMWFRDMVETEVLGLIGAA